jgi:hypothetical protein
MNRLGYLSEEVFAYALARFAKGRGEVRPDWNVHLSTDLKVWSPKSEEWLDGELVPSN